MIAKRANMLNLLKNRLNNSFRFLVTKKARFFRAFFIVRIFTARNVPAKYIPAPIQW